MQDPTPVSVTVALLTEKPLAVVLLTVQALRAAGCAHVIVIDPVESRLQGALDSGATEVRTSRALL